MTLAAVFPGQGSQYVGMCFDLVERNSDIADILKLTDKICKHSLSEIIEYGPKEFLDETTNAQPAVYTTNYIFWRLMKQMGLRPSYVVGHSLGELSACLAAGVFAFETGLRIVIQRAEFMAQAASGSNGGMAAIIGLDDAKVTEIAAEVGLQPANFNCPGQVVVSGPKINLRDSRDVFKRAGAKKIVELAVSGSFHSSAMKTAAKKFAEFLEDIRFYDPHIPIISNETAEALLIAEDVKRALARQLVSPVRWRECVNRLIQRGVDQFIEVGPQRVLTGLIKRISADVSTEHAIDRLSV